MRALKAHVKQGHLVVDEPTTMPEGTEAELVLVAGDDLDDAERAALHASIEESEADFEAGRVVSEEELWARLKALR
jgi:predicted transcriptional regulator